MAKTLRDVAAELGLSEDAVRKRLNLIRPYLNGSIQRGKQGTLLLDDTAVELLLRMEELRREEGLTLPQAAARLTAPDGDRPNAEGPSEDPPASGPHPPDPRPDSDRLPTSDIIEELRQIRILLFVLCLLTLGLYAVVLVLLSQIK